MQGLAHHCLCIFGQPFNFIHGSVHGIPSNDYFAECEIGVEWASANSLTWSVGRSVDRSILPFRWPMHNLTWRREKWIFSVAGPYLDARLYLIEQYRRGNKLIFLKCRRVQSDWWYTVFLILFDRFTLVMTVSREWKSICTAPEPLGKFSVISTCPPFLGTKVL